MVGLFRFVEIFGYPGPKIYYFLMYISLIINEFWIFIKRKIETFINIDLWCRSLVIAQKVNTRPGLEHLRFKSRPIKDWANTAFPFLIQDPF